MYRGLRALTAAAMVASAFGIVPSFAQKSGGILRVHAIDSPPLQRRVNKLSVPQRQPGSVGRLAAAAVLWPDRLQPSRRICAIATPGPDVGEK